MTAVTPTAAAAVTAGEALRRAAPFLSTRPLLIVSDFDGTLSPIVLDPWGAVMLPLARRALRLLAGVDDVHVAILSGRRASDVAERTRIGGASYLGNHGVESGRLQRRQRVRSLQVEVVRVDDRFSEIAEHLATAVAAAIGEPWLVVERKPPAVAFHFRGAPDVDAAGARIREEVERLDPERILIRFPGRRVLELRPPGVPDKGQAMATLIREHRPRAVFTLGDDISDAEAFQTLARARRSGQTDGLALAVQARSEVPPQVTEAADLLLASPVEAARFLAGLARRLGGASTLEAAPTGEMAQRSAAMARPPAKAS